VSLVGDRHALTHRCCEEERGGEDPHLQDEQPGPVVVSAFVVNCGMPVTSTASPAQSRIRCALRAMLAGD